MARRRIGHNVTRPSRLPDEEPLSFPVARDIQSVPGIPKRDNEVSYYSREAPLESVAVSESASAEWAGAVRMEFAPETAKLYEDFQRRMRPIVDWIKSTRDMEPTAQPSGGDVTETIREAALKLGYSEVGFAPFDPRYVYRSRRSDLNPRLPTAICLALEQDFDATQTIPSLDAERAQGDVYVRQAELSRSLVDLILSLGYKVQVSGPTWHLGPMIPMFVEAGLGQLGVNGQLLSPRFGSRARLQIILTDAKITHDKPVDYGIHKYCALCQVCVLRCPGRALDGQKLWYRGIEKNKLNFARCRPVMTRYSGCGICMKVCPIQKYGMKPVMEHYVETGEVLGKGTDNLEGYTLPDKGYFRPGRLPQFRPAFFAMPRGKTEDILFAEFKERLNDPDRNGAEAPHDAVDEDALWRAFRERLRDTLDRPETTLDMGMDMSN